MASCSLTLESTNYFVRRLNHTWANKTRRSFIIWQENYVHTSSRSKLMQKTKKSVNILDCIVMVVSLFANLWGLLKRFGFSRCLWFSLPSCSQISVIQLVSTIATARVFSGMHKMRKSSYKLTALRELSLFAYLDSLFDLLTRELLSFFLDI